ALSCYRELGKQDLAADRLSALTERYPNSSELASLGSVKKTAPKRKPEISDARLKEMAAAEALDLSKFRFITRWEENDWALRTPEYAWLVDCAARHGIRTVLEFGPGSSTFAFLENN